MLAGNHGGALETHLKLLPIFNALADDNMPANVKTALALQGRPAGRPRMPMPASSPEQRAAIESALIGAGLRLPSAVPA